MLAYLVPVINYHIKVNDVIKAAAYTFPIANYEWEGISANIAGMYFLVVSEKMAKASIVGLGKLKGKK
jgi:hypothetical protein